MTESSPNKKAPKGTPTISFGVAITIVLIVFVVSVVLDLLFNTVLDLPFLTEAFLDGGVVTIVLSVLLYFLVLKPVLIQAEDLKKFKLAIDNASDHIIITDLDGVIIYANKAAEIITGYSRAEMIGQKPSLWGRQMGGEFYRKMWHAIKDEKKEFKGEIQNKRKNGENYIAAISITPVLGNDGNIRFFVGIERDINKEKTLAQAQRDFVAITSHQLRTPLSSMKWLIELLLEEDLTDKQKDKLRTVYAANERLIGIVRNLLMMSRIESGRLVPNRETIDIDELIRSAISLYQKSALDKQLKLDYRVLSPIEKIISDASLVAEALKNIIDNAISYAPLGSAVDVTVAQKDRECLISVTNHGLAIPEEDKPNLFSKFYRGQEALLARPSGSGLGLYVARLNIQTVGGSILFKSPIEEGKGVTFFISLPMT